MIYFQNEEVYRILAIKQCFERAEGRRIELLGILYILRHTFVDALTELQPSKTHCTNYVRSIRHPSYNFKNHSNYYLQN